jgi:hypothetical protein
MTARMVTVLDDSVQDGERVVGVTSALVPVQK